MPRTFPLACVAMVASMAGPAMGCGGQTINDSDATRSSGADEALLETTVDIARPIDGDSLELRVDDEIVEVRLLGINAPELADCQGPAAGEALADLLASGGIEVAGIETDRFGRRLVWIRAGGVDVNEAMVRSGWAFASHGDGDHLEAPMRDAARDRVGLWGEVAECETIDARVEIVDAEPDPPGPDDEHLNDEYVTIASADPEPVDLTGWMLRDESTGNRYTFGSVTIAPGARITLRTGCGDDSESTLHWCAGTPVWSNRGETAVLLGPDGSYISHLFF